VDLLVGAEDGGVEVVLGRFSCDGAFEGRGGNEEEGIYV